MPSFATWIYIALVTQAWFVLQGVSWTSPRSALYTWAFCVPSSCSASDVESALNNALAPLNQPDRIEVMVNVGDADCHGETSAEITGVDIGMIILLAVTAVLLIGSTCYDIIVHWNKPETKKKSTRHEVLMSFSVRENCRKLFSTASGGDTMHCLNGLRFLSIFWIMLGHTFYMKSISPSVNQIAVKDYDQNVSMMLIMNGTLTTDTFFLLGGLLLCYTFMRYWEKNPSFNAISFYLQRYIRLTPPYAFVIFFYASLMYHLGSGPMWNQWVGVNRDYCLANWWTNLLYINNYVNVGEMCLNQTWYLAVDMQLFWVSPLILYPLARWPRFGKGLLATLTFVSVVIPFAITFAQNLTAAMLYTKDPIIVGVVYVQVYTRTYARAGPYLIGIALGYLLYKLKNKSIKIHAFDLLMKETNETKRKRENRKETGQRIKSRKGKREWRNKRWKKEAEKDRIGNRGSKKVAKKIVAVS
ncbi:hypothetical protein ANN_03636 [Periplaneta americana]|uniref:Acyltransferase 3 domain-containing protein n=1 Tax=Periplaneta americana TaxID=6978 RepID=A0ABQ8U3V3_PERAM|nr:hypothetical protein ANN_03636 [Periplaneta americana]